LLLIRIAEHETGDTWRNLRDELQRLHLGTFTGPAGTSQQRTQLTARQRADPSQDDRLASSRRPLTRCA